MQRSGYGRDGKRFCVCRECVHVKKNNILSMDLTRFSWMFDDGKCSRYSYKEKNITVVR